MMKRGLAAVLTAIFITLGFNTAVFAIDSVKWRQDDPSIEIYDHGSADENNQAVFMLNRDGGQWVIVDLIVPGSPIRLLMINGGFVPGAQIIVRNDRTLVPVRIISEILGAQVDWDANQRAVTITASDTNIILKINSNQATVNGQTVSLDAPATIFTDRTYVPLRFIAEAMKAQVDYTNKFNDTPGSQLLRFNVGMVTIEKTMDKPKFTVEDGLAAIKAASADTYNYVVSYLKETNRTFSDINPDYNSQNINYVARFGRYYVYRLAGFESLNILYNPYTGKIFSEKPGLPFLGISEGFINIGWLYQ